jgi:hypothetical protein
MNKGKRKLHVTEFCLYMIWTFFVTAVEHHIGYSNQVREDKSSVCQEREQAEIAVIMSCFFVFCFLFFVFCFFFFYIDFPECEMRAGKISCFCMCSKAGPRTGAKLSLMYSVPLSIDDSLNIYIFPKFMWKFNPQYTGIKRGCI